MQPQQAEDTFTSGRSGSALERLLETVRQNIVGANETFESPFGSVPCVYADWTASGRALRDVDAYIADRVLPYYGNTHTSTSITGHQTTCFRHEARQIIAQSVNAKITGRVRICKSYLSIPRIPNKYRFFSLGCRRCRDIYREWNNSRHSTSGAEPGPTPTASIGAWNTGSTSGFHVFL